MKKVKANDGTIATIIGVDEMINDILRYEFAPAFNSMKLRWDSVAIKDSEYLMFSKDYVNNSFAKSVKGVIDMFDTKEWRQEVAKRFGIADVNYISNAFDCDTYAAMHKMCAHIATAQHYPELGAAPAFGTISYISGGTGAEQSGVGHEINFFVCKNSKGHVTVEYFEPQEIFGGHGHTINLTEKEIASIFAVRI